GEICQSVPAYAGLRRFYSCAICNNGVPPSMPLTWHQKIPLLQLPPSELRVYFHLLMKFTVCAIFLF
ncbi:hypothetical protein E4F97_19925, partial [Shigella boydii]|nr:hypothetical protein [Shigella boydii]